MTFSESDIYDSHAHQKYWIRIQNNKFYQKPTALKEEAFQLGQLAAAFYLFLAGLAMSIVAVATEGAMFLCWAKKMNIGKESSDPLNLRSLRNFQNLRNLRSYRNLLNFRKLCSLWIWSHQNHLALIKGWFRINRV